MFSELGFENIGHCRETVGSYTAYRKHIRHSAFKIFNKLPYILYHYSIWGKQYFSYAYDRRSTEVSRQP